MKRFHRLVLGLAGLGLCFSDLEPVMAVALAEEYVTATPVLADGVLYVASSIYPGHRGHLRAIDILDTIPVALWDAAERMPLAGVGDQPGDLADSDPPASIRRDNRYRSLFTNLAEEALPLSAAEAGRLQAVLGTASQSDAELLLHAVRGRIGGSPGWPAGTGEDPQRLWAISRSSPALVGRSPVNGASSQRDRVLYAGAEDGMLHAFFVSRWNAAGATYLVDDPDGGTELWAYLPGSFLPHLQEQPLEDGLGELAVHLDGPPVAVEAHLDLAGTGRRRWHTLLVASGTSVLNRRSCVFVLDISDPYQPGLLWEQRLPGLAVGRTRGVTVDRCATATPKDCVYLTADFAPGEESSGIHALAVDLATGELQWQFSAPYAASGTVAEATPAIPALMDLDGNGTSDTLVFGDLAGQLWALDLVDGRAYGDAPVYTVPGGVAEPIGAGVAVHGRLAIFGTGGVAYADSTTQYGLYAVEILPGGGQLRWAYPLAAGERVWDTPVIDAAGNLLFATAVDYLSLARAGEQPTSGRVVALNRAGEEELSRGTAAANVGRVVVAPGVIVSVALTGEVTRFGAANRLAEPLPAAGTVKILSWRER